MQVVNITFSAAAMLAFILCGCAGDDLTPGSYTVQGYVRMDGVPATGVSVVIDNAGNWTTTTDSTGYFRIIGVTPAIRTINLTLTGQDGSFSNQKFSVAVRGDVSLPTLTIPHLMYIRADSSYRGTGIRLVWRQTDAPEFRTYHLSRREYFPLDDNSGTLIASVATPVDTTYADTVLQAGMQYYYRVDVFNELVRVCASNVAGMTAR